jgi:hypothetical protein
VGLNAVKDAIGVAPQHGGFLWDVVGELCGDEPNRPIGSEQVVSRTVFGGRKKGEGLIPAHFRFQVNDRIVEGVFFLGQRLDSTDDVSVGHTKVMPPFPDNQPTETESPCQPLLGDGRDFLVIRNEDTIRFGGVLE